MFKREDLHHYQQSAIAFARKTMKCGLFLDMGLGKTVISLTVASDMLDDFRVIRVLVISPLRVANTVWDNETKRWEHLNHLSVSICTGTIKERNVALAKDADIYVINRENVSWLVNNCKWEWDMVIIDESSSFKNPRSLRFKNLKKVMNRVKSVILLTGTPSPNGLLDLWSQIYLIDRGDRLGRTFGLYRRMFFTANDYNGYNYVINDGDAENKIEEAVKDVCVTMSAKDYLELPPKIDLIESVELPPEAKKQYKELEKEFVLTVDSLERGSVDVTAITAGVLVNKLLQICNGAVYDEDKNFHEIHDVKLKVVSEILEDNPNENFLIAYNYRSDLKRLQKLLPYAVTLSKSGKELDDWNTGKVRVLLAHPASAGHGLNAQDGGSAIIWFGLNWSLELYQQFNSRLHRQGQTKPVRIIHIVVKGCTDERVLEALNSKASTQNDLIKYLKFKAENEV